MKSIISKVNYDIHARAPVNKAAALAVGVDETYVPEVKIACVHSDTPLPLRKKDKEFYVTASKYANEMEGYIFGLFTVIGLAQKKTPGKPAVYVCRCACGKFEHRKRKAILNPQNSFDRCTECRHLLYLKRTEYFMRTGKEKPLEYFA